MAALDPVTDKQRSFIFSLVQERDLEPINGTRAYEVALTIRDDLDRPITRRDASAAIERLLECPKRQQAQTSQAPEVKATRNVPHGTYTVSMGNGSHVTLQFEPATFVSDRETTAVAFLSGSDNELSYTGFAFLEQDGRIVVWRKFREGYGRQQAALQLLLTG